MTRLEEWANTIRSLQTKAAAAVTAHKEALALVEASEEALKATEEARAIVQQTAQTIQEQAHGAIAKVVSRCLSAVFEEPYEFKILFEQKRGRTEAKMVFERNGLQIDPMTASGGGVLDVAALALRLACLMLCKPAARRILIFDEPFKSPSPHYRERIKQLLETLAEEMGVQFIFVTNIMELVTGHVIDLDTIKKDVGAAAVKRRLNRKQ